ncbi:hypothetical protein PCANC_18756 [Puccinia coronata f. sp. avenae]|uniref:Uncharacterized protein n=1 Tax=Puccinia coronata f. sp. avenae TaxID=200324 RepID=A0A2N5UEC6_9BASI|nr:hypothetical protein PCANC_18756 [Puccinia coronata f. sp. avenae]
MKINETAIVELQEDRLSLGTHPSSEARHFIPAEGTRPSEPTRRDKWLVKVTPLPWAGDPANR